MTQRLVSDATTDSDVAPPEATNPLPELVAAADAAYRDLRMQIIDRLPPGISIERAALSQRQREILEEFQRSERALTTYRATHYGLVDRP